MKEIKTKQGQIALVSDNWFEYLNQWLWSSTKQPTTQSYYVFRNEKSKVIYMHRLIKDTPKGLDCDHINHNTLDNQEHNLRNVTRSQNMMNRKDKQTNSKRTGINGVNISGAGYRAHISINKKVVCFPTRKTIEEAIQDRKQAEQLYYGEFSTR